MDRRMRATIMEMKSFKEMNVLNIKTSEIKV